MKQILKRVLNIFFFFSALAGAVLGQSNATKTEAGDRYSTEVITELRLTRQVIQRLQKELRQLQVVAIRIRLQQNVVASKEARLDSLKSETQVTEEALGQVQDRVRKLESNDMSGLDEGEQQRVRAEIEDTKKEIEREQQKLDALRYKDSELTSELQAERVRLAEMIAALEAIGTDRVSERSANRPKLGDSIGPPNK